MLSCAACGGEVVTLSMTAEGTLRGCSCGKTRIATLNTGRISMPSERELLDDCTERHGCTASLHLSTCPER